MTKNTFLIPWVAALLLLLVAGLFSNSGPVIAQEPTSQPIHLLPNPLTATLEDQIENAASIAEVGDELVLLTQLSVNPVPIGNQKIDPVYDVVYQLDADEGLTVSDAYDTTPIAYDDTYFLPSSTEIQISADNGLLAAPQSASGLKETLAPDQDFDNTTNVAAVPETLTTSFATITIGSDGSFSYTLLDPSLATPPADYFSYTITDGEGNQDTGSVILQFNRQRIFYVDSEAETAGNGLLDSPFQQLDSALAAANLPCDVIFLLASPIPYDVDHVELLDCQKLIGQDYAPYSLEQITAFDHALELVPAPTAEERPTIRCAQSADYLSGIDPTEMFPTTSQGCIELAKDNIVAGINIDNPDPIQKAIAGENFSTFWGFNTTALNSDGFSFSCNDSAAHEVKLTDSITVQNYGFIGIDLAAFPTSPLTPQQCILEGDLANVSVTDAAADAHEAIYAISQSAASLRLDIDQFTASNIAHSVIRATANDSSTLAIEVSNANMTDFDMVGVYVENYVFWPLAERERGLFASVTDSILVPNINGRGILANSQGNVASDLQFSDNIIGQESVQSDGIAVYGNNNGAVNAIINDNLLLSRGTPSPNLPVNQTHAPHMPLYFESNMPNAVGCLTVAGNQAPAGFNYAYGLETASLGVKTGTNGAVRIEGWNGQNGLSGAIQSIEDNNLDLGGGVEMTLESGSEISGGLCDSIPIPASTFDFATGLSQQTAELAGPIITIPVLPPGKIVTIQKTAIVNELAQGLDRVSAQGVYQVDGLNQSYLTLDPAPPAGFEDPTGRTVTPLLLSSPTPNLIVSDLSVAEDVGFANLTVELSEASDQEIQVDYATVAGTAQAGSDFVETSGQLSFPAGTTAQSIQIEIVDDTATEGDEQFAVSFSAVAGVPVAIPDPLSQITILANDAVVVVPTLLVSDATVSEGAGILSIELSLSEAAASAIGIAFATANGSAVAGVDYSVATGEVVFAPGATTATFSVVILDDAVSEAEEQFAIELSATAGSNVQIPDSTITITITDDDVAPVPNLSAADVTVNEGSGTAAVQINLDAVATVDLEIAYQTYAEVAVSPDDYTETNGTLTIPAGTQTASFAIPIIDDVEAELNEYFFVRLTTGDPSLVKIKNPELVVTIVDNDEILLYAGNSNGQAVRVIEDEGIAYVDISLNRPAAVPVEVDVSTQNLLAMAPSDYTAVPVTTLVFAPGELRKTVEITIIDDTAAFEGLERFRLKVENLVNATLHGNAFAEVVIIDNDNPAPFMYFEFADYSIYEDIDNNPATPSELDVVVKLSNPAPTTITVTVKSIDNASSATTPEDYAAINQIVTIPAGQREATVTVTVYEDDLPERQESFSLRFFDTSPGVIIDPTQNSTTVTIADGVPPVMRLQQYIVAQSFRQLEDQLVVDLVLSGNVVLPVRFGIHSFNETNLERQSSVSGFGSALRTFRLDPGTARFRLSLSLPTTHHGDAVNQTTDPFSLADFIIVDGAHGLYSPHKIEPSVRPYTFFVPLVTND